MHKITVQVFCTDIYYLVYFWMCVDLTGMNDAGFNQLALFSSRLTPNKRPAPIWARKCWLVSTEESNALQDLNITLPMQHLSSQIIM